MTSTIHPSNPSSSNFRILPPPIFGKRAANGLLAHSFLWMASTVGGKKRGRGPFSLVKSPHSFINSTLPPSLPPPLHSTTIFGIRPHPSAFPTVPLPPPPSNSGQQIGGYREVDLLNSRPRASVFRPTGPFGFPQKRHFLNQGNDAQKTSVPLGRRAKLAHESAAAHSSHPLASSSIFHPSSFLPSAHSSTIIHHHRKPSIHPSSPTIPRASRFPQIVFDHPPPSPLFPLIFSFQLCISFHSILTYSLRFFRCRPRPLKPLATY